ncbi:hypothetical protein BH23ACT6_BH23ACT6_11790 [soil metagenome]
MHTMRVDYRDSDRIWLACIGPDYRVYGYYADSNRFYFSDALHYDYFGDRQMIFTFISPHQSVDLINDGVGAPSHFPPGGAARLIEAPWSMSAEEVLGDAAADIIS